MGHAAPEPPHPPSHLQCLQQHALGAANRSTGCTGINAVQKTAIRIQTNRFMQEDAKITAGVPAVNAIMPDAQPTDLQIVMLPLVQASKPRPAGRLIEIDKFARSWTIDRQWDN